MGKIDDLVTLCLSARYATMTRRECDGQTIVDYGSDDCSRFMIFDGRSGRLEATANQCNQGGLYCLGAVPGFQLDAHCFDRSQWATGVSVCSDAGTTDAGRD